MHCRQKYIPSFVKRNRTRRNFELLTDKLSEFLLQTEDINEYLSHLNYKKIKLEIGFGDGSHLVQRALLEPTTMFIGCEVYLSGITNVLKNIKEYNINNITLFNDDARILLDKMPDNILSIIYILFPDPWPKKKHHKRRLVNFDFINILRSKIINDDSSEIVIATDHQGYASHIESVLKDKNIESTNKQPIDWIPTKYQIKNKAAASDFKFFLINGIN